MVVSEHRAWKRLRRWASAAQPKMTTAELSTVADTLVWMEKARKSVYNLVARKRTVEHQLLVIDKVLEKIDEYLLTDEGYAHRHIVLSEQQLNVLDRYVQEKKWGPQSFYHLMRQWFVALTEIRAQISERIRAAK